jgi:predicted nucleic acid-binding protein
MTDNNTSSVANAANVSNLATLHQQPKLLPFQKTKEQRATDVKPIIHKLNELQLNMSYEPIRKMYKVINEYIKEGESRKINIAFPEVKRRIKGFLSDDTRKETWMKLEADD